MAKDPYIRKSRKPYRKLKKRVGRERALLMIKSRRQKG